MRVLIFKYETFASNIDAKHMQENFVSINIL